MDISYFMTWWVQQLVSWFSWIFSLLDSITFAGTSLLRVIVTINILIPLIYVLLTIVHNTQNIGERVEQAKDVHDAYMARKLLEKDIADNEWLDRVKGR